MTDGADWLVAATSGGLPEPRTTRWQPLRIGIVDLWEYDKAEFWFAGGRLVLRGGNGAGKTKVLELTTLMLLRGEITASVLDPFGSQHRSMRYNLLPTGAEDDPRAPAESGLGYAWVEFGRRGSDDHVEYFVCGMGASARKGSGTNPVTTWHLITELRPGKDFTLSTAGRPIEAKELRKLDGLEVPGSAAAYRGRIAKELFDLTPEAYDNLTELLKQLRKPKLGERLNPTSLAETLRDALPPLSGGEITQLADGWEHLEQLRKAVEETEKAAQAVARFVRHGWLPWAKVVVRRRAIAFGDSTRELDNTTRAKNTAEKNLAEAQKELDDTKAKLGEAKQERDNSETTLRELLESSSYQEANSAAQHVQTLRDTTESLNGQQKEATGHKKAAESTAAKSKTALNKASSAVTEAQRWIESDAAKLADLAKPSGLAESTATHLPEKDTAALYAEHELRAERFAHLRYLHTEHGRLRDAADASANILEGKETDLNDAKKSELRAHEELNNTVDHVDKAIRSWAESLTVATAGPQLVADWCDLLPGLTRIDRENWQVLDGESATTAMRRHVTNIREAVTEQRQQLHLDRQPLATQTEETERELKKVREQTDTPPPDPVLWHRNRAELGAPLWLCVRPKDGVDEITLANLEAALSASGMLDAWLSPDGRLSTIDNYEVADTQLPRDSASENNLTALLAPTPAGDVDAEAIDAVLSGIGWYPRRPEQDSGTWLAADGSWRTGKVTGRAESINPASYLGATAREQARQRRIGELQDALATLNEQLGELDNAIKAADDQLDTLKAEDRAIPNDRPIYGATATLAERGRTTERCAEAHSAAQRKNQADIAARDAAWASFTTFASEHGFGIHELDTTDKALRDYRGALERLERNLGALAERLELEETTEERHREDCELVEQWDEKLNALRREIDRSKITLQTAELALKTDYAEQLAQRKELDKTIGETKKNIEELEISLGAVRDTATKAQAVLEQHEDKRATAEAQRDKDFATLWATVDSGLVEPLGLAIPERRNVEYTRSFVPVVRRELSVSDREPDESRTWQTCLTRLYELRQELLPDRDARIAEEPLEPSLQQVQMLVDPSTGWQRPQHAADQLAQRARDQREHFDAEQQEVLTTLLGSTFIEHLKERLDYTERTFSRINGQLADHPTRYGHTVKLDWEAHPADPDAGAVVTALGQGYQQLGTERQKMVREFLARKIDEAREDAAKEGFADWKEQLSAALDYRRWLRISLLYRPGATARWRPFDPATHGAKSGGEKVILLSQPLFAATVVAFDAASEHAPRWVWLDEAMTGVDAEYKASFMELTVEFDLDVMLTAHDEWCTYSTVPEVAVYDLARERHLPGVDVLPYLWRSGELTRIEVDRLGPTSDTDPLTAEGLFAEDD